MAARRNKSQARRTGGNNGTPGWVWLVVGVVIGAALLFTVPGLLKKDGDGFYRPKPNPDARPAPIAETDADEVVPAKPGTKQKETAPAKETEYEFYTLLPGKEVRISDAELAASARAEQERQRQLRAAEEARAAKAAEAAGPRPIDESASPPATVTAPTPTVAAAAETRVSKPHTVATAAPATPADARYILQAGAFGASGDAEATKARIALLGLSARVESAQIGGKTVYRVRMGPYGSAAELAEAKQKLANGGLSTMAIKAQ